MINIFNLKIIFSRIGIVVVGDDVDDGVIGSIFTYTISFGVHVAARLDHSLQIERDKLNIFNKNTTEDYVDNLSTDDKGYTHLTADDNAC